MFSVSLPYCFPYLLHIGWVHQWIIQPGQDKWHGRKATQSGISEILLQSSYHPNFVFVCKRLICISVWIHLLYKYCLLYLLFHFLLDFLIFIFHFIDFISSWYTVHDHWDIYKFSALAHMILHCVTYFVCEYTQPNIYVCAVL